MVSVELGPVDESERIGEESFWAGFDAKARLILGAFLDVVAIALRDVEPTGRHKRPQPGANRVLDPHKSLRTS